MKEPEISIITICRNESEAIEETVRSVLSQSYGDFEYIIKDGGSTDDTVSRAESYRGEFEKRGISFRIVSGGDKGIYDAMNEGVRLASGRWVSFMNAGDRYYDGETLSGIFEGEAPSGADLIYGDALEEEFGEFYYFRKCPELIEERMPFSHQSVFVKRELMNEYPFDLSYPIAADYNFLLLMHEKQKVFKDCGRIVAVVSKSGVSSVRLKDTYMETLKLRRDRGLAVPADRELKKAMRMVELKQFGMDHFPVWLKYMIRKVQRFFRHQKRCSRVPEITWTADKGA